jgi:hypothetical protein
MVTCASMLGWDGYTTHVWTALAAVSRVQGDAGPQPVLLSFESLRVWMDRRRIASAKTEAHRRGVRMLVVPLLPKKVACSVRINRVWCAFWIRRAVRHWDARVVHAQSHVAAAAVASAVRGLGSVSMVFDVHGVDIEESISDGRIRPGTWLHKVRLSMQRQALERADWILPVSTPLSEYLTSAVPNLKGRTRIVPCLVRSTRPWQQLLAARMEAKARLGLEGRRVVLYVGSAAPWQKAKFMCDVFMGLKRRCPRAFFLVISGDVETFKRHLGAGLPESDWKVISLPHEQVWTTATAGDVGLLFRDDTIVNHVASPTKLGEYLSLGVPVAVSEVIADGARAVREYAVGVAIDQVREVEPVVRQIEAFLADPDAPDEATRRRCWELASRTMSIDYALPVYHEIYGGGRAQGAHEDAG